MNQSGDRDERKAILQALVQENQDDLRPPGQRRRRMSSRSGPATPLPRWVWTTGALVLTLAVVLLARLMNQDITPPPAAPDTPVFSAATPDPLILPPADQPLASTSTINSWLDSSQNSLTDLLGLEVRTIVIDPGHGGFDPGSTGPTGLLEKDVTLAVAERLRERLEAHGRFKVVLTREDDRKYTLRQRVDLANQANGDLFVSLHLNYLPQEPVTLLETYYFGPESDSSTARLAARENLDSSYSYSDLLPLLTRLEDTVKQQESARLATHIQNTLYANLSRENDRMVNAGTKTGPFVVLLDTNMPGVLAELTCISNREEEQKLATPAYRDRIARYLEQGIVSYLNSRMNSNTNGEPLMTGARTNDKKETRPQKRHG